MRFTCRIIKATDTHSEYVIRITFPRQQWLSQRASMRTFPVLFKSYVVGRKVRKAACRGTHDSSNTMMISVANASVRVMLDSLALSNYEFHILVTHKHTDGICTG
jgi:hypothetical protein